MITIDNIKRIYIINQLLKKAGVQREIKIKEIATPEVLGVVLSIPSFFDETRPAYEMTFQENYLINPKRYEDMMVDINKDIEAFLEIVEKKYQSLMRITLAFEPELF